MFPDRYDSALPRHWTGTDYWYLRRNPVLLFGLGLVYGKY